MRARKEVLPYDRSDNICAIPETTVIQTFGCLSFDWPSLVRNFRADQTGNFKDFAVNQIGLTDVKASEFVERCMAQWTPEDGRDKYLERILGGLKMSRD